MTGEWRGNWEKDGMGSGKDAVCVRSVFIAASIQTIGRNPC